MCSMMVAACCMESEVTVMQLVYTCGYCINVLGHCGDIDSYLEVEMLVDELELVATQQRAEGAG